MNIQHHQLEDLLPAQRIAIAARAQDARRIAHVLDAASDCTMSEPASAMVGLCGELCFELAPKLDELAESRAATPPSPT